MPELNPNVPITADGDYTFDVNAHSDYEFSLGFISGTANVTVKRRIGEGGTDYVNYKLPSDATADMTLAATGTETGYKLNVPSNQLVFTVASASGLVLKIDLYRAH